MFLREPAADKRQDLVGVGGRDGIKVQERSYYKLLLIYISSVLVYRLNINSHPEMLYFYVVVPGSKVIVTVG